MSDIQKDGKSSLTDEVLNLQFNKDRWGKAEYWRGKDKFGYQWGGGYRQKNGEVGFVADRYLRPFLSDRYDLKILELSPGGGRFTTELIRYADSFHFLDMNQACLDICKERFKYYPMVEQHFYCNDGRSCSVLGKIRDFDLIACFDSMVHMHKEIAKAYIHQFADIVAEKGIIFIDHPGIGARSSGHRTEIYKEDIVDWAAQVGLKVIRQSFRNNTGDCISILSKSDLPNAL